MMKVRVSGKYLFVDTEVNDSTCAVKHKLVTTPVRGSRRQRQHLSVNTEVNENISSLTLQCLLSTKWEHQFVNPLVPGVH